MSASAADASPLRSWLGIAAFYAASFAVLGVYMQFFPVWLHDERGLSPAAVTVVMAAQTIARTIAGPLWSKRVDRTQRPRRVLMQLATASFCVFLLFGVARAEVALWACAFLFGCLYSPMHPIADTVAMAAAARNSFAYGRLRLVGSTSFLDSAKGFLLRCLHCRGMLPLRRHHLPFAERAVEFGESLIVNDPQLGR